MNEEHQMEEKYSGEDDRGLEEELPLFNIKTVTPALKNDGLLVHLTVENAAVSMEFDTGASVSLMGQATYDRLFPNLELHPTALKLKTDTGQGIDVVGERVVRVKCDNQEHQLPLTVGETDRVYLDETGLE